MNINRKSLEGLKAISEGLALFIAGLEESMNSIAETTTTVEEKPVKKSSKKSAPIEEPDEEEEVTETSTEINEDVLNEMSYNDLKKLAKDYGISAAGNRKELVKKLLSLAETEEEQTEEADVETEEDEKPTKKSARKSAKAKKPVEEEPDDEEEEESDDESDDEEDEDNSVAEQVNEAVADMSDDELRDILESVKLSTKGKRQALIAKIVTAVEEGLISLDDEETEEADEEEEAEESEESADITEGMTKKRKKAFEELCDETNEQFENDEITRDDLIDFINEFNGTKDKMKKVSDEDLITKYLELSAMMIDDDGAIVEEGAYYINEEPYCCGHPLTYDKKKKCYKCEHCGEEYDAE